MRTSRLTMGAFSLFSVFSLCFAGNVDVVVSHTAQDVEGIGDAFVRTRGNLSAAANVYRSDDRSPVIRTQAWLWTFPEGLEFQHHLKSLAPGDSPEETVYTWISDAERNRLIEENEGLARAFPTVDSAPGVMSRWESDPGEEWRLSVESILRLNIVTLQPRLERIHRENETAESVSPKLPRISMPAGESRILPVVLAGTATPETPRVYLEVRSSYDWGDRPPRIRQRDYTGAWSDRLDVGGSLRVEGVYTENVIPR